MPKKCTCKENRGTGACRNCSNYKLVFMLKKEAMGENTLNPVWYSILKEEKKGPEDLFKNYMLPRALKSKWAGRTMLILLYEKEISEPLFVYKP